jgi:8-oxo-dGTP pyrophosphatase MutT (NUDIX family)
LATPDRHRTTGGMIMERLAGPDVRCSAVVFRGQEVLLVHRVRGEGDDWVLPGGRRVQVRA